MIKVQASVSKGWLHRHGGFVFDSRYYMDPGYRMKQDEACHAFIRSTFPDYPIYNMEDNLVQAEYVVPCMMLVGAIQPNMIIAAALGAEFVFANDKDSDVKGYPLRNIERADQLPPVKETLQLPFIRRLAEQYLEAKQTYPDCRVIPPFFWDTSGRGTIHGIITTSMKFMGDGIFSLMMTDPDLVKSIHGWIADVYIEAVTYFSSLGNLPISSVHVGECSGAMISSESYREFVTPYVSKLGRELGSIRLHSCGPSDHIIEPICEIENLKIIDTGSNTSLAPIRKKMGKEFEINVFPPVAVLAQGASTEDMMQWLDRTLEENGGGNLKIAYHLEPDYSVANCILIHEELYGRGLARKGRMY
jgi:uroporphyrinogen-III decarboxylase